MKQYSYVNGKIVDSSKALISVNDIGLIRGYAVFDFLRTYHGEPFLWNEHFKRLQNSAKALRLKVPLSSRDALKIVHDLKTKNRLTDANIRIVITGGPTINGMYFDRNDPTIVILVSPIHALPKEYYSKGAKLLLHEHAREFPHVKTDNYITAVSRAEECRKKGAVEILLHHNGKVLEAATSNFFIVKGNKVITPRDNILVGATRNKVLHLARKYYEVNEREILLKELTTADEAFITATNKEILPIAKIDNRRIGDGKVGKVTSRLMNAFHLYVQGRPLDPTR